MSFQPPTRAAARAPFKPSGSSAAQRRAMTERRHQLSNTIRKARRSHAVSLKRRVGGGRAAAAVAAAGAMVSEQESPLLPSGSMSADSSGSGVDPNAVNLVELASAYVRSCMYDEGAGGGAGGGGGGGEACDPRTLSALQSALAKSDADGRSIDSLLKEGSSSFFADRGSNTPAYLLCQSLSKSLTSHHSSEEVRLDASRVLTNLAATGRSGGGEGGDYYGATTEQWCDVIVRSSALSALVGAVDGFTGTPPQRVSIALCEQCAWALGNVGGDSDRSRDAARNAGAIQPLARALLDGFKTGKSAEWSGSGASSVVGLCRNAAWALSNLARGAYVSARPFLLASDGVSLLTGRELGELLAADEVVPQGASRSGVVLSLDSTGGGGGGGAAIEVSDATWLNVANEVAWVIAFLSSREDDAVDLLFGSDATLCESLAYRLWTASRAAAEGGTGDAVEAALRLCVPCVRAVGNAAAACDGRHVASIITTDGGTRFAPIPASLANLVELGTSRGGDCAVVASEAAWAAGTLLCDAGWPPLRAHPSTVACGVLLPSLCGAVTSKTAKLELKREAVAAIGNAVAVPPVLPGADPSSVLNETLSERRKVLSSIAQVDGFIETVTCLLLSFDVDAVFAAVQLVDGLLRHLEHVSSVRRLFEEAKCLEALETICDRASSSSSYGQDRWQGSGNASERSAEIAADLIDDIFEEDLVSKDEAETSFPVGTTVTSTGESRFVFGADSAGLSAGEFDFGGGPGPVPVVHALQTPQNSTGTGRGRGRGRGKVMPAWMQQQPG